MAGVDGLALWTEVLRGLDLPTLLAARRSSTKYKKLVNDVKIARLHSLKPRSRGELDFLLSPSRFFPTVVLDLSHPRVWKLVTDEVLMLLVFASPHLESVDVGSNMALTNAGLMALVRERPLLRHLWLGRCPGAKEAVFGAVAEHCGELRSVSLGSKESLRLLVGACPHLEAVHVHSSYLKDSDVQALAQGVARLKSFSMGSLEATDLSVAHLVKAHPRLECLRLRCRYGLTDAALADVGRLRRLRELDLGQCQSITDAGVQALASTRPPLVRLSLLACAKLTDLAAIAVGTHCPMLEELNLASLNLLTDAGVEAVVQNCPRLKELILSWCPLLTPRTVRALEQHCPRLRKLHLLNCPEIRPGFCWDHESHAWL